MVLGRATVGPKGHHSPCPSTHEKPLGMCQEPQGSPSDRPAHRSRPGLARLDRFTPVRASRASWEQQDLRASRLGWQQ